ncbi:MAG: hypothetical protein ABMA64_09275 [Myxococcota bacterium]
MPGWFVWVACARVPLPEVQIFGGSDEVRAAIREELVAFDRWVGPGRLEVASVAVEPLGAFNGLYQPGTGRVHVASALGPLDVRPVVRHELCHALDYHEDLVEHPVEPFTTWQHTVAEEEGLSDRAARSEVLAEGCEWGPEAAAALAEGCPGEPAESTELFAFLRDEVWAAFEPVTAAGTLAPTAEPGLPSVELAPPEPWEAFVLAPTPSPHAVTLSRLEAAGWVASSHDVWTGEALPALVPAPDRPLELRGPDGAWVEGGVTRVDGSGAAFVDYDHPLFGLSSRVFTADEHGWSPLSGVCPPAEPAMRELVVAADHLWLAEGDGETIRWGPLD